MMEFHSAAYITAVILAVMFANYVLNFLVIGLPAILWGGALVQPVAIGLIVDSFTPALSAFGFPIYVALLDSA